MEDSELRTLIGRSNDAASLGKTSSTEDVSYCANMSQPQRGYLDRQRRTEIIANSKVTASAVTSAIAEYAKFDILIFAERYGLDNRS